MKKIGAYAPNALEIENRGKNYFQLGASLRACGNWWPGSLEQRGQHDYRHGEMGKSVSIIGSRVQWG